MFRFVPTILSVAISICSYSQTLYKATSKGKDTNSGSLTETLASLRRAVGLAEEYTGHDPVRIKMGPGLYQLSNVLRIQSGKKVNDTATYILEPMLMPDDNSWALDAMPVIQSVSGNNDPKYFKHRAGILVNRGMS